VDRSGLGLDSSVGNGGPAVDSDRTSPEGKRRGSALLIGVEAVQRGKKGRDGGAQSLLKWAQR
jgi:hypothetical protein